MNNRIHEGSQPAINPLSVEKQTRDLTSDHSQLSIIPVQKLPTVDNSSQFSISSPVIRPHSDGMLLCPTASDTRSSVQCCFTSTQSVRTIRDGEPRTVTSTSHSSLVLWPAVRSLLLCCTIQSLFSALSRRVGALQISVIIFIITSTETMRTIRDGEPRTATSTSGSS